MKKLIVGITAIVAGFIVYTGTFKTVHGNPSGAPAGASGSPADGGLANGTCAQTGCHGGTATSQSGLITSNIPNTGYIPGNTYTITAAISAPGKVRFGFEVSPQDANGNLLGTLVVTNSTDTRLVGNNTYITHKTAGNGGTDGRTWTFDWVAPTAGTGSVTFYGSLMSANNNNGSSGDNVFASSLTVSEAIGSAVNEQEVLAGLVVYPNPNNGTFKVTVNNAKSTIETRIFTADGKIVYDEAFKTDGAAKRIVEIPLAGKLAQGIYFAAVKTNGIQKVVKFVVE